MFTVAAVTSTHRIDWTFPRFAVVSGAIVAGAITVLSIVFLTGAIEFSARYALAIGDIIIGGVSLAPSLRCPADR